MEKTILSNLIRGMMICASAGGMLAACGGSHDSNGSSAKLLADGEACAAAWSSGTAYNGGTKVSRSGRNYTSAFWTQGQDPATNNGPAGSGQPWVTGYLCGSSPTPTPAPTPAPTPTPTPTGSVTMYKDCNYSGTWSASFGAGSYHLSDIIAHGGLNDDASSMRIPAGYTVTLYQDDNFTGASVTLTSDNSCFVGVNFNDKVSSMIVSSASSPVPTPTPTPAPTPTPSCSYQTWTSGVSYPLGTIVKYPANGNFYKEVNSGTNGSDGTDPTISTWYWSPTTCGSSPTPTPTPTPTPSGFVVTEAQFNSMFPGRGSFYTYQGLVNAAGAIAGFASTGSDTVKKQEAAAFLANVAHETGGLVYVEEIDKSGNYCASEPYGCPAGTYQYYGRGPLQLSWNFNYKAAGDWLGIDLLDTPSLLATDATASWKSAIWYWMTQNGPPSVSSMTAHAGIVNGYGFGQTIKSINGDIECVGGAHYAGSSYMQDRVNSYNNFVNILGVPAGSNVTC